MKKIPTSEVVTHSVAKTLENQRLDVGLTIAGLASTRSQSQKAIEQGRVTVNGLKVKASYKLQNGDAIEIIVEKAPSIEIVPYEFPLDIVYEDDQVLVVNKPAGLVVHPAVGHREDTLINALVAYRMKLSSGTENFRPGLVHRLDKDTSGLIVLAKNEEAHSFLAKQFLRKTTHRRYWAVCFGSSQSDEGSHNSYLCRDPKNRKRFIANNEKIGKHAITHYKVLEKSHHFSLLELSLETGRTHQIRVHLSADNMPIVGDDIYHGKKRAKNLKSVQLRNLIFNMDRFALHAKELGFVHPATKEKMLFNSPIAEDLKDLYELCGFKQGFGS